jgi:hypothetical protein
VLAAFACGGDAALPRPLHGRWITRDPRYAGRSLTISPHSLLFASDRTAAERFGVRRVEARVEDDGSTAYKIAYGAERGEDLVLRLRLSATTPASLTIGDRREHWTIAPRNWGLQ